MDRNRLLFYTALFACAMSFLATWIIASLDKTMHPRLGGDLAVLALLFLPYAFIATLIVWNRRLNPVLWACLLTIVLISAIALPILWADGVSRRHEGPGREVQHYGLLVVFLVEWAGSGLLLVGVAGYRLWKRFSSP